MGAKAANLGELISAGMPVPTGFCLPACVYDRLVKPALAPRLDLLTPGPAHSVDQAASTLREAVEAIKLPASLRADLERAYREVCSDRGSVAVRSSGTSEDTAEASFAGQYHTELGVRSFEELVAAVTKCWASMWEVHAIHYRERVGVPHAEASMAVVVQAMVPAESAGVMFVTARSSGAAEPVVIESSWGLGEAVVSGLVTPDRFSVSRADRRVKSTNLGHKAVMVMPMNEGTSVVDVAPERQTAASITPEQAAELAGFGLAIEAHFGSSQDIEWAIADGKVMILQARPLTRVVTTPADLRWESPIDGAEWARISICDSWLPEPLSPLFATTLFPRLVEKWKQNWSGSTEFTRGLLPDPMAGTINGYAYIRLDGPLNKYPVRTARLVFNFFRFHLSRLEREWRRVVLPHHIERIGALRRLDLRELKTEELLRVIDETQDLSGSYWALLGGLAWYWNGGEWLLNKLYPHLVKPATESDGFAVLLQGYPTKTSEIDFALYELARAGETPDGFARFLAEYGHQAYQLDFVEPTPADDPSAFRVALEAYRGGSSEDPRERLRTLARRRAATWARIESALRGAPVRWAVLRALLRWNRRYTQVRDEALYYFTLGWPTIRHAYLELGRRLVASGTLCDNDDVFYLTGEELMTELRTIERGDRPRNWGETVGERRERREKQKQLIPPAQVPEEMRIDIAGVDFLPIAFLGRRDEFKNSTSGLSGVAVSPGYVTAPARQVASVQDFDKLQAGEVLVTAYITPAWSPLLGIAGAIVTDIGGALSHGSIVAREYGIPAVMGTTNATKLIREGQLVTVDGNRGLVLTERSAS